MEQGHNSPERQIVASLFTFGMLLYYWVVLRRHAKEGSILAMLLWCAYVLLGMSGIFLNLTGGIEPVFEASYPATLLLLACVLLSISGFLQFRVGRVAQVLSNIRGQRLIENSLIYSQLFSMVFFLPFAIGSLTGDINENRIFLDEKMEIFRSFGLLNTMAGAAAQLFSSAIIFAFIRLTSKKGEGRSVWRASLLFFSSFSYIVYILAYVGRDGVVYWLMTALMILLVFWPHLESRDRKKVVLAGVFGAAIILIPFVTITISRFFDADQGAGWSLFEYFGAQIHNFSDYSSIDRPLTLGLRSFPMFIGAWCGVFDLNCLSWPAIQDEVFQIYLDQGKVPWVFGTFISDFAGDFGNIGALLLVLVFSTVCAKACSARGSSHAFSVSRLLMILFLCLVPYWGVFYFRFSISNGYIIVNLMFIMMVAILQRITLSPSKQSTG